MPARARPVRRSAPSLRYNPRVLRQGPLSTFIHGVVEYVAALILIAGPFVFGFDSGAATAFSIVLGVAILVVTASSGLPTSLINAIPVLVHVIVDFAVVALLIASPFVFGFSDETAPTALFIVLGIAHLLVTIGTRFLDARVRGSETLG